VCCDATTVRRRVVEDLGVDPIEEMAGRRRQR